MGRLPAHLKWKAGHDRNQRMLDEAEPDLVVAFKDDFGAVPGRGGTEDIVARAKKAGIPVYLVSIMTLVAIPSDLCPDCGDPLKAHEWRQPALLRDGGFGEVQRHLMVACAGCLYTFKRAVESEAP